MLNQCIASTFAHRDSDTPYLGLYGACSTFAEGILIGALMVNAGYINHTAACVSSHFCTAERKFRTPLEYGAQRTPTAQWTVTGAGCAIIGTRRENAPFITAATIGAIKDGGITDANNMGAAMAPAAFETIYTHMKNTGTSPKDYDMIATGIYHVGEASRTVRNSIAEKTGFDCGCEIFDSNTQDTLRVGAVLGGGCSARIVEEIKAEFKTRTFRGRAFAVRAFGSKGSIPAICHLIELSV